MQCFDHFDEETKLNLLNKFNVMKTKNEQDSHLAGLITIHAVQRHRPRKRNHNSDDEINDGSHNAYYTYKVRDSLQDVAVCQKAFLSLYGIKRSRLRRIQNHLLEFGTAPTDQRGKHETNRYKKTPIEVIFLIEEHIRSFKVRQSHYSIRKNPLLRFYLPEDLSVRNAQHVFSQLPN